VTDSNETGSNETDSNDWRVTISLPSQADTERAQRSFSEHEVEDDIRRQLGRSVAISAGDSEIFLYAGTELAARQAEQTATELLSQRGIRAEFALHRWHPIEEEWEDPAVAMPQTDAEREAEHQRLEEAERAESLATGAAQWEARVEFPSHRDAVALARKLRAEGRPVLRRWKFLVVGANSEDDARALAEQIRREAPSDATITAEASGLRLPFIPF
jgi:hypothetical protein